MMNKTHVIATCKDCCWSDENYKTAQTKARYHAKSKKHNVNVQVGYYYDINEKTVNGED